MSAASTARSALTGSAARDLGRSLIAVAVAILLSGVLIQASGYSATDAFQVMWDGAFGGRAAVAETLRITTTLLFTSLGFTIAFRVGVFNLGGQGQFAVGSFAGAWIGFTLTDLPGWAIIALAFAAGMLVGALTALGPALLLARYGVNEVISTLMLSFIVLRGLDYLVQYPFRATAGETTATKPVAGSAELTRLLPPSSLSWALILGLVLVVAYACFLRFTALGYEMEMVGTNRRFAEYGGLSVTKVVIIAMVVSGAIAGLGGVQEVLGVQHRYMSRLAYDAAFAGIAASFLARNRPLGLIPACLFLGALQNGALQLQLFSEVPRSIAEILTGLVVLLAVATTWPWRGWLRRVALVVRRAPVAAEGAR
ncbi:MAG: ABC transporter permease [Nocardioidaceae bacterium]|nr:ABC transporter permease [Nocardioidaceae bacterium]